MATVSISFSFWDTKSSSHGRGIEKLRAMTVCLSFARGVPIQAWVANEQSLSLEGVASSEWLNRGGREDEAQWLKKETVGYQAANTSQDPPAWDTGKRKEMNFIEMELPAVIMQVSHKVLSCDWFYRKTYLCYGMEPQRSCLTIPRMSISICKKQALSILKYRCIWICVIISGSEMLIPFHYLISPEYCKHALG